jgi:glycosyltransferase involved in cell wall biosynthesis
LRKEFGIKDDEVVVGYAGRLSYEKGMDILIEAMERLLGSHPECVLLIAGEGAQRKQLEDSVRRKGIEHRVRFAGFVKDVNRIMNAFDIGVVPSRREAFGLTAVEMMSVKVPVVCSEADGLKEIVSDGQTGLVCQADDPAGICECIKRFIETAGLKEEIVEAAYKESAKYSVAGYIKQVESIYKKLLEEKC